MINVLLLRAPTKDGPDKYESALQAAGFNPISVPVLETVLTNVDDLASIIKQGPGSKEISDGGHIRGVIITSARACEAWRNAVELIAQAVGADDGAVAGSSWVDIPFYVVGKTTASALREISGITPDHSPRIIRGEGSGTGEQLARFIMTDWDAQPGGKLLYLTGDKNRDTLANILASGGVSLVQLQAYETRGSPQFASDLTQVLANTVETPGDDGHPWWIVFFAPSAAEFVLPHLRQHFDIRVERNSTRRAAFIAAIGPTTSEFLTSSLGVQVHATAPKPTPSDLVAAIKTFVG